MPACDSVNDRNTPTAYSGISALVMPPNAMIEHAGRGREHDHTVREHEAVATVRELARQVAVVGDDRRQPREVGVRGVRREREDRRGRELQDHVQHRAAAEHRGAQLRHHRRLCSLGYGPRWWARICTPMNSVPRMTPIHTSVVAAFFDSGRRNAGTPLEIASTPVSATAPDEKPFSRMKMPSVPPTRLLPASLNGDRIDRVDVVEHEAAEQAVARPARRGSRCRCRWAPRRCGPTP